MEEGVWRGVMIDLLYHATIYYEIHKYIQESECHADVQDGHWKGKGSWA